MKKSFDDAKLLDAALADESWESCNARLRSQGLAALHAAKQARRGWAMAGQITAMIGVIAGLWWSFNGVRVSPRSAAAQVSMANQRSGIASSQVRRETGSPEKSESYITEEQMLAMFPQGSCVLAEINGEKQLVVFEGKEARAEVETPETRSTAKTSNSSPGNPAKS